MPFSLRSIRFLNGRKRAKKYEIGASIPKCGGDDGQPTARFIHRFPLCSLYVQSYAMYENEEKQGSFLYILAIGSNNFLFVPFEIKFFFLLHVPFKR